MDTPDLERPEASPPMPYEITVSDCERAQTSWCVTGARALGGEAWNEGGLTWARAPGHADLLALTRLRPKHTWYAAAYTEPGGRFAGHAWSHLAGDAVAGVFDMAVWPPFRRHGLGTALLQAACAAAGDADAEHAVLNATPEGKELYQTRGFHQIGEGITWWLHPDSP